MMSSGPPPARPDGTVDDARWLFPQERAPPPRIPQTTIFPSSSFGFSHSKWLGFSLSEDHSAAVRYFNWRFPLVRIAVAGCKKRFESAVYDQLSSSILNRCYEEWQMALTFLRSSEDKRSCHQAVLCLERDMVTCDHLCQVHLPRSSAQVMTPLSPTTTTPSAPPSLTHPSSYLGAVLSPNGEDCKLPSHVLQATTAQESAAIMAHRTARQPKRPHCRQGRRNIPRVPNHSNEAIPTHPQPKMGGNFTSTKTLPATSARATTHCSMKSSPMSYAITLSSSPSLQPFLLHEKGSIKKGERDAHQQKGTCRWIHPRRVGQRHRPRAPNPLNHLLCGGHHRPRASNQSTGWA